MEQRGTENVGAIEVVALAASAGGIEAVTTVLQALTSDFPAAVVILMHLHTSGLVGHHTFSKYSPMPVEFLEPGKSIQRGRVYVAPPGQAIELEPDGTATLVPHRNADRPIDATLGSIAQSYAARALAVILTGMRDDGARGVRAIKEHGGLVLAQSPDTATHRQMPDAAIATGVVDLVLPLGEIGRMVDTIVTRGALPPTRQSVAAIDSVFGGGGEVGTILRGVDWAASPLGPVETWSAELRSTVRTVLAAATANCVFWGPELVYIYNDVSIAAVGVRHPRAAGQPLGVAYPEGDMTKVITVVNSVRESGVAIRWEGFHVPFRTGDRWVERYFNADYNPVVTERGVEGVLCPYVETTDIVLARRRMTTLGGLAAVPIASSVNDALTALVRVLGQNRHDVPFVIAYELDHVHRQARLKASAGVEDGSSFAPVVFDLTSPRAMWPLAHLIETRSPLVVSDLLQRFRERAIGPWDEPTLEARLHPLGGDSEGRPTGALVVGLNPRRPLDDRYREFLDLAASQVSAGIIGAAALELNRARVIALAEANRAKADFFSNVSHEFRTPLTLILGHLERARALSELPPAIAADLEVAERNARRLLGLVSTLLDIAQADAQGLTPSFESTDIVADTKELGSLFRAAIEHAGLAFDIDTDLERHVRVDRSMWAKIVVNLVANALKYTFDGGIRIELRERAQHAELVVSDTGVGIPAADLPHVFERFFRSRSQRARTHEGSGIGLALVKELVQHLHGRVRIKSVEGEGTAVTVWIPLYQSRVLEPSRTPNADERDAAHTLAQQALSWTRPSGDLASGAIAPRSLEGLDALRRGTEGARVLVVDDNRDMRNFVERLAVEMGWSVEGAADGIEAFEKARATRPDLVVTDVMMPRSDGFELLKRIRADKELASTPVILVTARAAESAAVEGLIAGADDYIAKPFTSRELVARLGGQIQLARMRGRAEAVTRASQERQAFMLRLSDALRAEPSVDAVANRALRMLLEHLELDRCYVGVYRLADDRGDFTHQVGNDRVPPVPEHVRLSDFPSALRVAFERTLVIDDVAVAPGLTEADRGNLAAMGFASLVAATLREGENNPRWSIVSVSASPRKWTDAEVALLEEAAERTWVAMERVRA